MLFSRCWWTTASITVDPWSCWMGLMGVGVPTASGRPQVLQPMSAKAEMTQGGRLPLDNCTPSGSFMGKRVMADQAQQKRWLVKSVVTGDEGQWKRGHLAAIWFPIIEYTNAQERDRMVPRKYKLVWRSWVLWGNHYFPGYLPVRNFVKM